MEAQRVISEAQAAGPEAADQAEAETENKHEADGEVRMVPGSGVASVEV